MKLLVGLGNPGNKYEKTRHNIGFKVLEKLLEKYGGEWGSESRIGALISHLKFNEQEVILALPQTYMNLSGDAVKDLLRWYKLDISDLIVVHDELDLPFVRIQVKKGGSAAGHNGVQSIIDRIGSEEFVRVRVGIGSSKEEKAPYENYVLEEFNPEEIKGLKNIIDDAAEKIELIVKYGYEEFVSRYNK